MSKNPKISNEDIRITCKFSDNDLNIYEVQIHRLNIHGRRSCSKYLQNFKSIGQKLLKELRIQDTPSLCSVELWKYGTMYW